MVTAVLVDGSCRDGRGPTLVEALAQLWAQFDPPARPE